MLEDNVKSSQVKEKEKEKKNDLISLSESESFNSIKVNQTKKTERNKYICPEEGCDLIPRIINVHSEIGTIVMQCPNNHINDIDVEEYLEKIESSSDAIVNVDGKNTRKRNTKIKGKRSLRILN